MLIKDSTVIERQAARVPVETQRERTRLWCLDQLAQQRLIEDAITNPTNLQKQWGNALSPWQFFGNSGAGRVDFPGLLAHIDRNLIVERDTTKPGILQLYYVVPERKKHITPFYEGILPEFSLFNTKIEDIPDPYCDSVDTRDFPKAEFKDWKTGWQFDERDVRPGWIRVKKPWNEIRRGWRTILAYLVREGFSTPDKVERLVGDANNASWMIHMGRDRGRNVTSAW